MSDEEDAEVHEPDPASIRAAGQGDVAAFEQLVVTYQPVLWRYLCHLLDDRALAEDVAQDTMLRVYERLPSYRFESKFSTWLLQVGHNLAVDAVRRRERGRRAVARLGLPRQHGPGADLRAELNAALGALSPKLREALLAVEVLGLSYREAGEVLSVPEGTVKSRVHAARVELAAWSALDDSAGGGVP